MVDVDPAVAAPRPRPRWLVPLVLAVALAALGYGAWRFVDWRENGRWVEETNDAYVRADGVAIAAKLAGYVAAVEVRDNQAVAAGAPLIRIDPTDFQTRIDAAETQIRTAQAAGAATLAGLAEAQAGAAQARAALAASEADARYLDGEIRRYTPLVAAGAEPATVLAQLRANRAKAAADIAAKRAMIAQAEARLGTIRAQGGQSEAQVAAAAVQRRAAANDLAATRIVAPIAGRAASLTARVGQFVQPGQRLATIVPTDALYVEANFKETQIGLMRPGQPVTIRADALDGVTFRGTVESITPGTGANFSVIPPQNATGNFTKIVQRVPVRIRLQAGPESRRVLVPGLSLTVAVDTRGAKGALDAIRREQSAR